MERIQEHDGTLLRLLIDLYPSQTGPGRIFLGAVLRSAHCTFAADWWGDSAAFREEQLIFRN